jgi:hypothetical protein
MGDVVRGLRQALMMLLFSAVAALLVAGLWWAPQGDGVRSKVGIASMVIAGLISLSGGTAFSRAADYEERAFLGMGADRDEAGPRKRTRDTECSPAGGSDTRILLQTHRMQPH